MKRPERDDYDPCRCNQAQYYGFSDDTVCGGCEEHEAAVKDWEERVDRYDPYAAADALADERKDEDIHRG